MDKETEPEITPLAIVNSILMGELRPEDRKPDEVSGYYFDFFIHPSYPAGAAVVIQWAFQDGAITTAAPVHAFEWAEYLIGVVERDMSMLPDVAALLFDSLKYAHTQRGSTNQ